jgi:hypothetical protein
VVGRDRIEPLIDMSSIEIILRLLCVAALSSYLWHQHRRRHPRTPKPCRSLGTENQIGKAIDVTVFRPVIEVLRREHFVFPLSAGASAFHKRFVDMARQTVARLAWFRGRDLERHDHGLSAQPKNQTPLLLL